MFREQTRLLVVALTVLCAGVASGEAVNLVVNPGFEEADGQQCRHWSGPAAVYSRDTAAKRAGAAALKFVNPDPKNYALCSQQLPLVPGRCYEVSAWGRTENVVGDDSGATVCLEWYAEDGQYVGGHYPAGFKGTTDWQQLQSVSGRVPANAARCSVTCYVRKGMTGTAWWDDIAVTRHREDPLSTVLLRPNYRGLVTDAGPPSATVRAEVDLVDYDLRLTEVGLAWAVRQAESAKPERQGFVRSLSSSTTNLEIPVRELAPGSYLLDVSLVDQKTNAHLSQKTHRLARVQAAPRRATYLDEHNRLVVNGEPFFPLGMYWSGVTEDLLRVYADSAFNCLMPYGGATPEQMDLIHKHGLKIIYTVKDCYFDSAYCPQDIKSEDDEYPHLKGKVEAFRDHPALLAWYLNDELSLSFLPRLKAHQQWLEELDPGHPTWVVLYQVGQVRDYIETFDAIGTDPYPIPGSPARRAAEWTRQTVEAVARSRPAWQVPQVFNWACYRKTEEEKGALRPPTLEEMRSMAWQCIAEGARGLVFYSFFDLQKDTRFPFEQQWPKVKTVAKEISDLIPVLLSVESPVPLAMKPRPWLHTLTRQYGGSTFLVLVNDGPEAGATWVRLPAGCGRPRVRLGSDTLTDQPNEVLRLALAPFEVKVLEFTQAP
jgi:hypothetical protein